MAPDRSTWPDISGDHADAPSLPPTESRGRVLPHHRQGRNAVDPEQWQELSLKRGRRGLHRSGMGGARENGLGPWKTNPLSAFNLSLTTGVDWGL